MLNVIENTMVINQNYYDVQNQPLPYKCCHCKDLVNEVVIYANGDEVCEDCKQEYLLENGNDFAKNFIADHQKEFYMVWWFDSLSDSEKLRIAKLIFSLQNSADKKTEQIDFCKEHDYFPNYVKERLM